MLKTCTLIYLGLITPTLAFAQGNTNFIGDFESGKVQPYESRIDGYRIRTLPDPQVETEIAIVSNGGAGPASRIDTRVMPNETVPRNGNGGGNEVVTPRKGNYFLRSVLYKDKIYSGLQPSEGKDKPRSALNIQGPNNSVEFDEEGYLGFSIYLPSNLEHETTWDGKRGDTTVLQVQSRGASWSMMFLGVYVPSGGNESHWLFRYNADDSSLRTGGGTGGALDLGPVSGDQGKWTDFVLRYRFNPFSTRTNASTIPGGKDQFYDGNKGILQLWKASGPVDGNGDRTMSLVVGLENEPVGLVPHATEKIRWHFRIYKGNWKSKPSSIKGPIWLGFDEIRDGRVQRHGTGYSDVHPSGLACTNRCPENSGDPRPLPPDNFVIID